MPRRVCSGKRAAGDVVMLHAGTLVLSLALVILVMLPFFGDIFGLSFGRSGKAAYSLDNGFARLIRCTEDIAGKPDGTPCYVAFTVDDGFFVVAFDTAVLPSLKATRPPDCNNMACVCICTDKKCEKIEAEKNKGRNCRPLYDYDYVVAESGIKGNDGGVHPESYEDGKPGRHFHVEGEKTIAVRLQRKAGNLYIGKHDGIAA